MFASILICSSLLGASCSSLSSNPLDSLENYGLSQEEIDLMDQSTISSLLQAKKVMFYTATYPNTEDDESEVSPLSSDVSENYQDSYVTINLIVSDLSNGKYHFYATSKWDKWPFNRGKDSFSICANGVIPVFSTVNGYVTDICKTFVSNKGHSYSKSNSETHSISSQELKSASEQNTSGIGYLYDLPNNKTIVQIEYTYSDVQFHLSFDGVLQYPNQTQNFNVFTIHDHLERSFAFEPSLTFSTNGSCFGLGLNSSWMTRRRYAVTKEPIHYDA